MGEIYSKNNRQCCSSLYILSPLPPIIDNHNNIEKEGEPDDIIITNNTNNHSNNNDICTDYKLPYLRDGDQGILGPLTERLLAVNDIQGIEDYDDVLIRVGVHRRGTCFFHSILDSMNLKAPSAYKGQEIEINGHESIDDDVYRNLSSLERRKLGREWRSYLASHVNESWFTKTISTTVDDDGLPKVFDAVRGRNISMEQFRADYSNPQVYVGDSVWPHVSRFFNINLFIVVVSRHGPRIYLGESPYDETRKSIVLYLHDKRAFSGHYESIQTKNGKGVWTHKDALVHRLLFHLNYIK